MTVVTNSDNCMALTTTQNTLLACAYKGCFPYNRYDSCNCLKNVQQPLRSYGNHSSAIVVKWCDRYDRWSVVFIWSQRLLNVFSSVRSDHSNHMETNLKSFKWDLFRVQRFEKSRVKFCLKHFLFVVLYESRALTEIHTSMFELWQPLEMFSAFSFERNFHFFRVSLTICIAKRNWNIPEEIRRVMWHILI